MRDIAKRPSLAQYALSIEVICDEIEACESDVLPPELLARFQAASTDLAVKTESWIGMLEAAKSRIDTLKEQRERITKAIKAAENFQVRLKNYLVHVMQAYPDVPYRCESGRLALQKNPESVRIDFETKDTTIYAAIDSALLALEPSLNEFVEEFKVYSLNKTKIKAHLKAGGTLPWARLETGMHVRIRQ